MVDRKARALLASSVLRFYEGEITSDEFQAERNSLLERYVGSGDMALLEISGRIWLLCDDYSDHQLKERHFLTDEVRGLFERSITFLRSDLEYEWPVDASTSGVRILTCVFLMVLPLLVLTLVICLTLGWIGLAVFLLVLGVAVIAGGYGAWVEYKRSQAQRERFRQAGDRSIWPFMDEAQYEETLAALGPQARDDG